MRLIIHMVMINCTLAKRFFGKQHILAALWNCNNHAYVHNALIAFTCHVNELVAKISVGMRTVLYSHFPPLPPLCYDHVSVRLLMSLSPLWEKRVLTSSSVDRAKNYIVKQEGQTTLAWVSGGRVRKSLSCERLASD